MPVFAISALVGIITGLWVPVFPSAFYWPLAILISGSLAWWLVGPWLLVAIAALGAASLHAHWYYDKLLPASLVRQDIVVEGVVADLPRKTEFTTSFMLRLIPDPAYAAFPRYILLQTYAPEPAPVAGERWIFKVRLKRPVSSVNSQGFDFETWLLANDIHARGYVRSSTINHRVAVAGKHTQILRFRNKLRGKLQSALVSSPVLPLISGISLGVRDQISAETWQILRDSGTSHLVAISGLHIGLIAMACWWPGRLLGWLLHCMGLVPQPLVVARCCVFLATCAYGSLAGFSIPTTRASIMVIVVLLLATFQRQHRASGVLSTALLIVLALDPLSVLAPGFWLSFLAVALLYTFLGRDWPRCDQDASVLMKVLFNAGVALRQSGKSQLLLSAGLALPSLFFFAQLSLIAPLANLVAVPLFTVWIMPATLVGLILLTLECGLGVSLLNFAAYGLEWLMGFLAHLVTLPTAVWQPGYIAWSFMVLALAGILLCILPRPFPGRMAGLALLSLVVSREYVPDKAQLRVRVLDVGQGLSVLVQTPAHNLLYDTGAAWRGGDAGDSIIVPELMAAGVGYLDVLIVSHDDADHSGGVKSILKAIPVGEIISSGEKNYGGAGRTRKCRRGQHWQWGQVEFDILHPGEEKGWSDNDASCVLRVSIAGSTLLLPGDIEGKGELALLRQFGLHEVDLVLGPHHGSRTSSTRAFVSELGASYVVFASGYANRWNFPVAEVVGRWIANKGCVLTTANSGALDFVPAAQGGFRLVAAARASLWRPWPLRSPAAGHCIGTINRADGTV
jgi:competence protein ComEC